MKVIFQAPDKLFIAGHVQDYYPESNGFPTVFRHFQKEVFSQSDQSVLPSVFNGIIFKSFHWTLWFCHAFFGSPKRICFRYSLTISGSNKPTGKQSTYKTNTKENNVEVLNNVRVQKNSSKKSRLCKTKYQFLTGTFKFFITLSPSIRIYWITILCNGIVI